MRWGFVLMGQPPSVNASYRIVRKYRQSKSGERISYNSLKKADAVQKYQDDATLLIRAARPSRWTPPGMVRIRYRLFLHHDMDADNPAKTLNDAIQGATGINDGRFLTCCESKTLVPANEARVEVIVDDQDTTCCFAR